MISPFLNPTFDAARAGAELAMLSSAHRETREASNPKHQSWTLALLKDSQSMLRTECSQYFGTNFQNTLAQRVVRTVVHASLNSDDSVFKPSFELQSAVQLHNLLVYDTAPPRRKQDGSDDSVDTLAKTSSFPVGVAGISASDGSGEPKPPPHPEPDSPRPIPPAK